METTSAKTSAKDAPQYKRRKRGFERAIGVMTPDIRRASEGKGFSEVRLLTHWEEIVGAEIAKMATPLKVSYAKGGFGATLVVLTTGSYAPILQSLLPQIKERVNGVYGYNAISRIHITQTAPTGFHEGRATFLHKPAPEPEVTQALAQEAQTMAEGVSDDGLKSALETLAQNFLKRQTSKEKDTQ